MEATATRKADFARLFDLFERLTNRALRKSHRREQVTPVILEEASKPFTIPADLASIAIRNLASIASKNEASGEQCTQETSSPPIVRADGDKTTKQETEAAAASEKEKETGYTFPVGPFTFKMRLHKLYELEEWARKVKEVLERSRQDYRSLSEMDLERKQKIGCETQRGQLQLRPGRRGKARSNLVMVDGLGAVGGRRDSDFINADAEKVSCRASSVQRALPDAPSNEERRLVGEACERVIKKRCVIRQKGGAGEEAYRLADAWTYDSAAVLTEAGNTMGRIDSGGGNKKNASITFVFPKADDDDDDDRLIRSSSAGCLSSDSLTDPNTAHRKRALSEADIANSERSPRKRPYLS